ncbi:MAG TPA: glycosyltransferase family 4 protein [Nitrospiraceae bacterium]|nr:glycosyltransferase family 4 protein [Nitrospiraceae bacterium]
MIAKFSILLIGPTPPPFHGVSVAIQTLLQSCIVEQFRVCHLDLADRRGIQHVNKPDLQDVALFLRQWLRLVSMLFRDCPTLTYLVLSQSTIGFLRDSFLIWPASLRGSHIVLHLHGANIRDWFLGRSWFMRAYVRAVLSRVTRIIVLGDSLKSQFDGLVDTRRIAVVPNGIEWKDSGSSKRMVRSSSPYRILHLSTLSHLKGALVLIEAIPSVVTHRKDLEFVFAGPWSHSEDKQWADQFILQQGIGQYIKFTGQVEGDRKRALFESSDIFAFPGIQQEGQPLVVIEAMAAGLPVIFTDRGCLRNTVINGETGVEVPINDPHRLADRILWLLDHPDNMEAMGRRARQRYESLYTKKLHIENMIEVFASSCTGNAARTECCARKRT